MKRYLVTCSAHYYPRSGCNDWVKIFENVEDAVSFAKGYATAKQDDGLNVTLVEMDLSTNEFRVFDRIECPY